MEGVGGFLVRDLVRGKRDREEEIENRYVARKG
jgi:hypothetical protein